MRVHCATPFPLRPPFLCKQRHPPSPRLSAAQPRTENSTQSGSSLPVARFLKMALRLAFVPILLAALLLAEAASAGEATYGVNEWSVAPFASGDGGLRASPVCDGRVGDCVDEEEEMAMESESTRRSLARSGARFISYGALSKNRVPCNRRGQSYYNCQRQKRANPYRRGCSTITRCARDMH
ncbi:unnamed protein product [Musa acuminata var. zebrina]